MTRLVITRDNTVVREVDLDTRDLRIGRAAENDITLEDVDKSISRMHAELRREPSGWVLLDLNSQNGIWADGRREARIVMQPGVAATVGPYTLRLAARLEGTVEIPSHATAVSGQKQTAVFSRPPVRAPSDSGEATSALRASQPPRPPAAGGGPIAALFRLPRPLLFGGSLAIVIAAVVITSALRPSVEVVANEPLSDPDAVSQPSEAVPAASSDSSASSTPALPDAAPAARPSIATHLADGEQAILDGRYEAAIADHLERVLLLDPKHQRALELKARAQQALTARNAPPAPASPAPAPAAGTSVTRPATGAAAPRSASGNGPTATRNAPATPRAAAEPAATPPVARRPSETVAAWRARVRALEQRFAGAEQLAKDGSHAEAARAFAALLEEEPTYPLAAAGLEAARAGVQAQADGLVIEGRALEAAGQLAGSVAVYERALALAPSHAAAEAALRAARGRLQAEAEAAYGRARQFDALTRVADALREYEKALAGLAPDDPRRSSVAERIKVLRNQPLLLEEQVR